MPSEHPIIFKAAMVRALLDGTKTQTRRVVKTQPDPGTVSGHFLGGCIGGNGAWSPACALFSRTERCAPPWSCFRPVKFPYGDVGSRLWVRETFAKIDGQTQPWIETDYRATYQHGHRLGDTLGIKKRWTPAIHMPREASRLTLEVTGVRVERLHDISEADAIAEGVHRFPGCRQDDDAAAFNRIGPVDNDSFPIARYAVLWEQINGPGSWDANPWVWVIDFHRVEARHA